MGSGKSYIGKLIADKLQLPFVDLDCMIEAADQDSIPNIFADKGESYFRQQEAKILRNLPAEAPFILATGGGTPCFFDNMSYLLQNFTCFYLKPSRDLLEKRLLADLKSRPLLKDCTSAQDLSNLFSELEKQRAPYYEKSHFTLTFDEKSQLSIPDELQRFIESAGK